MFNESISRRQWLNWGIQGLASTALISRFQREIQEENRGSVAGQVDKKVPRAKRAIQICLVGGLSHLDSFDYKPTLVDWHGKSLQTDEQPDVFFGQVGLLRKSDWEFRQHGQSGLWISDLFPEMAQHADRLTVIRSMTTESANHTPALFFENSGFQFNGFPSLGSWLSYGLGSLNETLPDYVVLPDRRGGPNGGPLNWSSAFLPAQHQGVVMQGGRQPVRDLFPARPIQSAADDATKRLILQLDRRQAEQWPEDELLQARMRSYALAAQMQLSVPEVSDLSAETEATRRLYGLDQDGTREMGERCLLARRLLEQGVRFVQLFSGGPIAGSPRCSWDAHEDVRDNHSAEAARIDRPIAALLTDLAQRGLLEDTVVMLTTEFGRTPFTQSAAGTVGPGRDHNRYGFSIWMAGAGLKPGTCHGATDDIGWKAVEQPATWHDFHATLLHLFGIDHEQLTFYHNGIRRRLTNVHGQVQSQWLADA